MSLLTPLPHCKCERALLFQTNDTSRSHSFVIPGKIVYYIQIMRLLVRLHGTFMCGQDFHFKSFIHILFSINMLIMLRYTTINCKSEHLLYTS